MGLVERYLLQFFTGKKDVHYMNNEKFSVPEDTVHNKHNGQFKDIKINHNLVLLKISTAVMPLPYSPLELQIQAFRAQCPEKDTALSRLAQ